MPDEHVGVLISLNGNMKNVYLPDWVGKVCWILWVGTVIPWGLALVFTLKAFPAIHNAPTQQDFQQYTQKKREEVFVKAMLLVQKGYSIEVSEDGQGGLKLRVRNEENTQWVVPSGNEKPVIKYAETEYPHDIDWPGQWKEITVKSDKELAEMVIELRESLLEPREAMLSLKQCKTKEIRWVDEEPFIVYICTPNQK